MSLIFLFSRTCGLRREPRRLRGILPGFGVDVERASLPARGWFGFALKGARDALMQLEDTREEDETTKARANDGMGTEKPPRIEYENFPESVLCFFPAFWWD